MKIEIKENEDFRPYSIVIENKRDHDLIVNHISDCKHNGINSPFVKIVSELFKMKQ